jgi:hypothetical protein
MTDVYQKIGAALDRFQETHFWIHMLEQHYHNADPFRWHLNVFLKAVKEVPQIVEMELQQERGFKDWYQSKKAELREDSLMKSLAKSRDLIVHKGMLVPNSRAQIGITEGRGMKLGLTFPVHPLEDSDDAMERYLRHVSDHGDFLGILIPDEDSMPCVYRQWHLEGFDKEVVDLCAEAWFKLGAMLKNVLEWLGAKDIPELSLNCRHASQRVHYHLFDRNKLIEKLKSINGQDPTEKA